MKKNLLRSLLVGAMTLSMAFAASAVTFAADETPADTSTEPAVTTWAQLYQGMGLEAPTGQEGYYDAVSSATGIVNNHHYTHIPTVIHQNITTDENDKPVSATLDGVVLSGTTDEIPLKVDTNRTGWAKIDPRTTQNPEKLYGTDKITVYPDNTCEGYNWMEYKSKVYAVTISDGTTTVGAVPWIDFYVENGHVDQVEIALNNGKVPEGCHNGATVHRFDAFYTDGVLNAGTYHVEVFAEGYSTLKADIVVPTWTEATVAAEDVDASATSTPVTLTDLPEDYDAVFTVDGTDVTYADGAIHYDKLAVGERELTVTDRNGKYNALSAKFTVSTSVAAAAYSDATATLVKADGVSDSDFANYITNITKTVVAGKTYNATGRRGVVKVIGADGTIDLSNTDSATSTVPVEITVFSTGYPDMTFTVPAPIISLTDAVVTAKAATYTGKALTPAVTVTLNGAALTADDYDVAKGTYTNAGKYTVTVTGKGKYTGTATGSFVINKAAQKLSVSAKTQNFKAKKVKKKAQTFAITKAVKVSGAKAGLSYQIKPANAKAKKALKIKGNKVTVKKKTKKGTYKLKVTVKAAANANYNAAASVTKTVTVKVK